MGVGIFKKKIEKENSMLIEKGNRLLTWFLMGIESLMWHVLKEN
jgi:hypothetical protein